MEDARALLDSLMGQTRNAGKEERKKKKGDSFRDESVCKYHLVGFCPEHEDLFHNTRRELGECRKTHFEYSREELKAHPEREKYTARYEAELIAHLRNIIRHCDDWAAKERAKNQESDYSELAKKEIAKLHDEASRLVSEAEDLASNGNIPGSKAKLELSDAYKKRADVWTEKAKNASAPEVCEVCGLTKENQAGAEKGKIFSHEVGKVHQGFALIRKWYADLTAKQEQRDQKKKEAPEREAKEEDGGRPAKGEPDVPGVGPQDGDRRRARSRSRDERRDRGYDRDRGVSGRRRDDAQDDYGDRGRRRDDRGGGDDGRRRRRRENDEYDAYADRERRRRY